MVALRPVPFDPTSGGVVHVIESLFGRTGAVLGVVHLGPLPGAPRFEGPLGATLERARSDAAALVEGGVDGLVVENFGDAPFFAGAVPPETVAAMTRAVSEVRAAVNRPVGVNVLRNDARAALAVAAATGAAFIRVNVHVGAQWTDQGLIEGRAAETLRARAALAPGVRILADVAVKHAAPVASRPLAEEARECLERGLADAIIVTGSGTGAATDVESVRALRGRLPGAAIVVGSGVTADTVADVLAHADAVIVGTALKEGGDVLRPVDPTRVAALVRARDDGGATTRGGSR